MKRAHLVNFLAIMTQDYLSIRASLTMKESTHSSVQNLDKFAPSFPIQAYKLLNAYHFKVRIKGYNQAHEELFSKDYESDSFGAINIKIPSSQKVLDSSIIEIYEIGKYPGLEILLGTYMPLRIEGEKKLIICDFDKTLVDTKYSTPEEIYKSLTSPIHTFPTIKNSVEKTKSYIEKGFHPFILSASPHFYEDAMRDWLYANSIFSAGIFLKDYRKVFSIFEGDLTPKDLKVQGIYKLNHLLDIIHMTGIPDELVLMGDNFESDPLIYLTFFELLKARTEPRFVWNKLKKYEAFKLSSKQNSMLLNKIFQLKDMLKRTDIEPEVEIFIRKKVKEDSLNIPSQFDFGKDHIRLYEGHAK